MTLQARSAGRRWRRWFSSGRLLSIALGFLTLNSAYLCYFVDANLVYVANALLHFGVGLVVIPLLLAWGVRLFLAGARELPRLTLKRIGFILMLAASALGVALAIMGGLRANQWLIDSHMVVAAVAVVILAFGAVDSLRPSTSLSLSRGLRLVHVGIVAAVIALPASLWLARAVAVPKGPLTENPPTAPLTMEDEAMGGNRGPFFPSSMSTSTGGLIPPKFFTQSQTACQRCHTDIYKQWSSSAHRFSSFNNQWYTKSIEYMQEVNGIQSSKWCAGCHDVAVLSSGLMDKPVQEIAKTPEGQAGLGCMTCHTINKVKSTMGQGDYYIEYPLLHRLANSEHPLVRVGHDLMIHLSPEAHRRTFLKPFHRSEGAKGAEFCVACHKVHLDVPVNNYRWFRGFNEYDAWQASGMSGQGARSFYYPPQAKSCGECHMPLVPSQDKGNRNGLIHSHRFPGANTALPVANNDAEQLKTVIEFLKGAVSVDVFAVARTTEGQTFATPSSAKREPLRLSTTFAVGEEAAEGPGRQAVGVRSITAPIDEVGAVVRQGESVLIDVVVRNRKPGHFFPGGTVDAFDVWVELRAIDANGKVIFWSGAVEDDGKGPVEKGAHFYRAYLLDAHGNHINKRNAWAARSVLYGRLVPPGAADTVHFRLDVPKDAQGPITLEAKVNYRKFMWWNTQFAFRGMRDPSHEKPDVTKHYDDGRWMFDPAKKAPDLPIVVVAETAAKLGVVGSRAPLPDVNVAPRQNTRERWNDFGIGLFLQGDLRHAERAFLKVTEIDPGYADGWVNVARVRIEEGDAAGAIRFLEKALALAPDLAKSHYFMGLALKAQGKYEDALAALQRAAQRYPRDRVVRNEIGKTFYLLKRFDESVAELQHVIRIDPEDLTAHYTLMLNYRALGKRDLAEREHKLYQRFKADESSQAITGEVRRTDPHANNERQPIHEHRSVPLPWGGKS
jgi:Tfp pilus assembly protein PilF